MGLFFQLCQKFVGVRRIMVVERKPLDLSCARHVYRHLPGAVSPPLFGNVRIRVLFLRVLGVVNQQLRAARKTDQALIAPKIPFRIGGKNQGLVAKFNSINKSALRVRIRPHDVDANLFG